MANHEIDQVCRTEGARVIAGLIRRFGDFSLAEDALQDAFEKALSAWTVDGIPDRPAAWLTTVAQHRALDIIRRRKNEPISMADPPDIAAPDSDEDDRHPADITGVSVFDRASQQFHFRQGPIFTQLLLADEVNRASPRTAVRARSRIM